MRTVWWVRGAAHESEREAAQHEIHAGDGERGAAAEPDAGDSRADLDPAEHRDGHGRHVPARGQHRFARRAGMPDLAGARDHEE
jgi:hypothetical protein